MGLPNGQQIICSHKCSKFRWQYQNNEFITEVLILPLSKWDAILGVSWLKSLMPVLFDYGNLTLEFTRGEQSVKLTTLEACPSTEAQSLLNNLTIAQPSWTTQLVDIYEEDQEVSQVITELLMTLMGPNELEFRNRLLKFRGKMVVGSHGDLRKQVYEELLEK